MFSLNSLMFLWAFNDKSSMFTEDNPQRYHDTPLPQLQLPNLI